jgi:hypothetical protein
LYRLAALRLVALDHDVDQVQLAPRTSMPPDLTDHPSTSTAISEFLNAQRQQQFQVSTREFLVTLDAFRRLTIKRH